MEMRGITQTQLSAITDIPKSAISQYLSGRFNPRYERISLISHALNVNMAWLLGLEASPAPKAKKTGGRLSVKEQLIIEAYRSSQSFKKSVDLLFDSSESVKNIFRAAKSDEGNIPPIYEELTPKQLKMLSNAPETDEDI